MILIGTKCQLEQTVTQELTAAAVGSGALPVFGTPFMAAMMENAALTAMQTFLEEGQGSVGTRLDIHHDAPTPIGMKVWAEAEITGVSENGKMVESAVRAWDETGPIGGGTHTRAVINCQRFLDKCNGKLNM
nr:thioesterase family protein [uncultured Oscillibacter sp.]